MKYLLLLFLLFIVSGCADSNVNASVVGSCFEIIEMHKTIKEGKYGITAIEWNAEKRRYGKAETYWTFKELQLNATKIDCPDEMIK